jgi:multicomponent Na+:H+ antiporter subunit B
MTGSVILSTATRILVPLILVFSLFIFFRGHNAPGGGFIGGLLAATCFALIQISQGVAAARRALRINPLTIGAFGLGCALVSGLWGGLTEGDFLAGMWPFYDIGLPIGSIMLFDAGVYLVVLGVVTAILFTLEEEVAAAPEEED